MTTLPVETRPQLALPTPVVGTHDNSPPVVILNMFYSGLGIARALSGKGLQVIGLSADATTYGNFTRLCKVEHAPSSKDHPEQLLAFLLQRQRDLNGAVLFPTRDADVIFLDRFRSELSPVYRLAIPAANCLYRTLDKHALALAAQQAGVPVPRTLRLKSSKDLVHVAQTVGFPCVLKPISAFQWHVGDAWQQVGARKAVRVETCAQLGLDYDQISRVTPEVLVQEWIPGSTEQITVLGGYVNRRSELVSYFTARKVLQSPDDCGTGCIVQSEPIPGIVEPSRRLFKALGYKGMAEVEYKLDTASGNYKLIEINTRHWDQHALGLASGINLTWVAYCDLTERPLPAEEKTIVRAQWVAEDALLLRLLRSMTNRQLRVWDLRKKLSPRRVYGIYSAEDPVPILYYSCRKLIPDLGRSIVRKLHAVGRRSQS